MSNSLGTFFWLSFIYTFVKIKMVLPWYIDVFFVLLVIIFMYFINVAILQEKCGNVDSYIVLKSTVIPWILIFANMMYVLNKLPNWKTPFSNTFGLLVAKLAGVNTTFLSMLKPQDVKTDTKVAEGTVNTSLHYVYSDPSLLINKFTMENFDATVQKLAHIIDTDKEDKIADFKQFVKMKECISEWIWYLLTACITVSVSYNNLISIKCTKTASQYIENHNNAMADTGEPKEEQKVYTVTE